MAQQLRPFADGARTVEEPAAVAQQLLACRSEHEAAPDPVEKLHLKLML